MAITGRKPKPKVLKDATGRDHHGAQPKQIEIECDTDIYASYDSIPEPRQLWDSMLKAGVVKTSDRLAFMRYVSLLNEYVVAQKDVKARGQILYKGKKNERYNPSWRIMRDSNDALLKLEAEFGMTPSSKRRVMQVFDTGAEKEGESEYEKTREGQLKARYSLRE